MSTLNFMGNTVNFREMGNSFNSHKDMKWHSASTLFAIKVTSYSLPSSDMLKSQKLSCLHTQIQCI
jgi:hypothetical protein